jgi:hypothetical protein
MKEIWFRWNVPHREICRAVIIEVSEGNVRQDISDSIWRPIESDIGGYCRSFADAQAKLLVRLVTMFSTAFGDYRKSIRSDIERVLAMDAESIDDDWLPSIEQVMPLIDAMAGQS